MNICDAIKKAGCGGGIYRESDPALGIIIPTNTDACCIIANLKHEQAAFRWNPCADDLTADDWQPTGLSRDELRKE